MKMETIKEFEKEIKINQRYLPVKIKIKVCQDELDTSMYMEDDELARYMSKLESGEQVLLSVTVEASVLGLKGFDSIGNVDVTTAHMLRDIVNVVEENSLVENALEDLRSVISYMARELRGLE